LGPASGKFSNLCIVDRTIINPENLNLKRVLHSWPLLPEMAILTWEGKQVFSSRGRSHQWARLILLIVLSCLALAVPTHSQSTVRDPTPAEKKVVDQYANVIHSFLDTFDSDDWNTKVDFDVDESVQVSNGNIYPLDVDELIQRSYTVKNGSPLYQREVAPFLAKMEQMSPAEMAQAGKKLKMLRLEVQVHFNRAAVDKDARTKPQLQVPGAVYSYMTEQSEDKRSQTVVLTFGDWKSAQQGSDDLKFHFKHPPHTPVVENIVVQLQGSPDRIRELLQSADWKRVNQALIGAGS